MGNQISHPTQPSLLQNTFYKFQSLIQSSGYLIKPCLLKFKHNRMAKIKLNIVVVVGGGGGGGGAAAAVVLSL